MLKKLYSLALLALLSLSARAAYVPVALNGFNTDGICNGAGAPNTSTTNLGSTSASPSGFDAQGYWLMDSTFNPGSGTTNVPAMPGNLLINSSATSGLSWQLKPYTGNNVMRINSIGTDSLVFQTPQAAGELYILYTNIAPGSTSGNVDITVNFTDGTTQVIASNPTPNWFSNIAVSGITSVAYMIGGRYNGNSGGGFQNLATSSPAGPQLYQFKVNIAAANLTKTIRSVQFANTVTGHILNVFGITLNTTCSGTPVAGATVSSVPTACPGVSFTLSLPNAANTGVGTTYQWQSSATGAAGSWTNISGATSATYAATQTATTYYRAYITCNGGPAADTSTALSVGMTAVNQCYCIPVATSNTYYIANFTTTGATTNVNNTSTFGITSMGYSNYTAQTVSAVQGSTVNFSIAHGSSNTYTFGNKIYVDWNQNGVFTDAGETMFASTGYASTFSGSFTVPATAYPGNTRMRVISDYYTSTGPGPCAYSTSGPYGEAEDYSFTVTALPACPAPTAQPTALTFPSSSATTLNGSFTAAAPVADKYLVVRTQGAALNTTPQDGYTYATGAALGNGTVVSFGAATTFSTTGLSPNTTYTFTIFSANNTASCGPTYYITNPLTGNGTTPGPQAFTWTATSGSGDWQVAGNWTPSRPLPDASDTLYFTNGGTPTATNIPSQTVGKLVVGNNTNATFNTLAAGSTLTISSQFNISSGATLNAAGANNITLAFPAVTPIPVATIAGTLNLSGTGTTCTYNAANSVTTISGTVNASGTNATVATASSTTTVSGTVAVSGSSASLTGSTTTLTFTGTGIYNHARNGGTIPSAIYNAGSNVNVTGATTSAPTPPSTIGGNLTWNCPSQTGAGLTFSSTLSTLGGTFNMVNTGTGSFQFGTSPSIAIAGLSTVSGGTLNCAGGTLNMNGGLTITGGTILGSSGTTINVNGNVNQTGGFVTSGTTTSNVITMNITGNVNQSAGVFSETSTGSLQFVFNGPSIQTVALNGVDTGILNYRINNTGGINLTSPLKINNGATLNISNGGTNFITGTGVVQYGTVNSTLSYSSTTTAQVATATEWPISNPPVNVTANLTGTAPANRLTLPGNRTLGGTLTLSAGLVMLDNNDLTIANNATGAISVSSPGTTRMVAVTGTGQLKRAISTTANTAYLYPIGDTTGGLDYSPANITFVTNSAARTVGVRVTDAQHPNDASATNYLSRYWSFTDDGGAAAYAYNGTFTYNTTTDVVGTESALRLNLWNGTAWSQIPSQAGSGVLTIVNGPSSAALPLGGNQVTGRQAINANTYTWVATSGSADWQVPASWTPARNTADPSDVLLFTNGGTSTATNIPTQVVSRIAFSNNTITNFQAPATAGLTLASDGNPATNELDIAQGSSLVLNGTGGALTLAYSGTGGTGKIAGNLEVSNTGTVVNAINFTNAIDTVAATGTLAAGGTLTTGVFTSTAANLVVNGTYNHKYTTANGGAIPTATWGTGSTVLVSGYTTATGGPNGGLGQTFSNFTYNCPGQTVNGQWSGTVPTTVNGTLSIISTGTGQWQWNGSSTAYTATINNYTQTGGVVDLGTSSATSTMNIGGTFNQTAGVLKTTGTGAITMHFNGTAAQNVNFVDSAMFGPIVYRFNNPAGITLTGSGLLSSTPTFKINNNGGVRISGLGPVTTALTFSYGTTATLLTYDAAGTVAATAAIWPATNGPLNVTSATGTGGIVTVPFSRTVAGTLTMTSGDLDFGANTLTLGTSAASAGTLTYTAGNVRLTSGSFVRWYGTTGLPTAAGTGVGFYPIAYGAYNRNVALYFNSATALSTGGTVGVSHTNVPGMTTGLSVADGAYTINNRTNTSWSLAASGIVLSGTNTIGMRVTGQALFISNNPANLRVMQANAVAGSHVAGSGVTAQRSGLVVADLAVPYYIGAANGDINGAYIAINTGNWSNGATWDVGSAPAVTNDAFINPGVTVTVDAATNTAKSLNISTGGTLTVNANTLTIDSAVAINGTVNIGGGTLIVNGNSGTTGIINNTGGTFNLTNGTVTIGPAGGGNKRMSNAGGVANISGGNLNINGNLDINSGSFNQTGGTITIDGNSGTAATSVASGTHLCAISPSAPSNFNGGTMIFVDPPHSSYATSSTRTLSISSSTTNTIFGGTHTVQLGDGVSTTIGNSDGFVVETWASSVTPINNLVVNGGSATGRWGSGSYNNSTVYGTHIRGNVTINTGSELRTAPQSGSSSVFMVGGNIVNNGTLTSMASTMSMGAITTVFTPAAAQTITGTGVFQNNTTGSTANFRGISLNNSFGITPSIGTLSFSGTVTFNAGATGPTKINMGTAILSEIAGAGQSGASQANGWVNGRYQKAAATGSINNNYPIGDANYYTPVTIAGSTGTVTTAGAIWVSTTVLDHPSVNTSEINPGKSINRYYTIQTVNGIAFTAGSLTATFNWNAADVDAGTTTANLKSGFYNGTTWTYPTVGTPTATSLPVSGLGASLAGDYQVGERCSQINITTQPVNTIACAGSPVSLSVALSGTSFVNYQWQKGSTPITGATNATYTISNPTTADAGTYSVVMTSSCTSVSSVTSNAVTLTVNTPPAITTQPSTQTICEGSPVTFTAAASGTGPLSYQWYKGASPISGATNASYTINVVAPGDAGSYTVVVTGASPCANATSSAAVLSVNPLPLTITASGSTTFCAGGSVTLSASATSGLTYQWKNGGTPIGGATNATYVATNTGNYTATITNTASGCSNTSNSIAVTNATPASTITPSGTAAFCQGGTVTLTGPATSGVTYQWNLNGNPVSGATNQTYAAGTAGNYTLSVSTSPTCTGVSAVTAVSANPLPTATATPATATTFCQGGTVLINGPAGTGVSYQWRNNGAAISGATNNNYTANASGNYKIVVTNTATGCIDSSAAVAVTVNPLPTATITPASATTFCAGGSVVLNANTGTGLAYQWNAGGNPISGQTNASYTATASGSYTVTVTNTSTNCVNTSAATTVTVNPLPTATATAAGPTTFCQGGNVVLNAATASGQSYQWKLNGGNIGGATSSSYTATAAGSYTVLVTTTATGCNATSNAIVITVNPLPTATVTPATTQTICQGDSVTYNANTGTGLAYQWKLGGNTITGATNASYVAYAPGAYTVTVTTTATGCSATSAAANLVVNPRPVATISYTTPITFCDGGAVVLSGNAGAGYTYQWQQNGIAIPGATSMDNIVSQSGLYNVIVTNSFGCSSAASQPVQVTVNPLPVPVITRNNSVLSTGSFVTYQWFLNNAPVAGGTGQSIVITQNGGYAVQVTDANGCTNRSPIMFVNNVGIVTPGNGGADVKIYPNPAHQVVYIDAPVSVNVAVRDLTGKVILAQDNVKEINLEGIADGVYMIFVSDKQGRLLKTEKLFKSE